MHGKVLQQIEPTIFHEWQSEALWNPYEHFAFYGGVGTGKTFTGAHFVINHILEYPNLSGFVGANTYDQLSQVALRELFYWLDYYGFDWVSDCRPPRSWNAGKVFKDYSNILSVRTKTGVVYIFTRVMSKGNFLRGLEFSWYWIDELRDTEQESHDIVLGRMRESDYRKGLVTTTTNGENWDWERFVKKADGVKYGYMHIPTQMSVDAGIVNQEFLNTLKQSLSPQMAKQELDAKHIILTGLPVYYAYSEDNETDVCPFTRDGKISPHLPIAIAPDFNINPMSWALGQEKGGEYYWFDEVRLDTSNTGGTLGGTQLAASELVGRVKDHPAGVSIAGDATSKAGQRAAAGQSDYDILCKILDDNEIKWTNLTPESNPTVKDRINNVNAKLRDADGNIHMWHHPRCKYLKRDWQMGGWKEGAQFVLDPGKKNDLHHMSDGVGYYVSAVSPIASRFQVGGLRIIRRG